MTKKQRDYKECLKIAQSVCDFYKISSRVSAWILTILQTYDDENCQTCHQTGTVFKIDRDELITDTCLCVIIKKQEVVFRTALTESNIPKEYLDLDFKDWHNPGRIDNEKQLNAKSFELIKKYSDDPKRMRQHGYGLFICGPHGVGKTLLACAVGKAVLKHGFGLRYFTLAKIISLITEGWYDNIVRTKAVNEIENIDFLIVDDCDKVYKTNAGVAVAIFDNMFRERVQNNRPTILTSNITIKDIEGSFNSAIHSMLLGHSAEVVIVGEDFRQKMNKDIKVAILGQ